MQTLSQPANPRTPTTEMEVTSIRLERDLKKHLKDLAGSQGYQALIRDVLWAYVRQQSGQYQDDWTQEDICATVEATAQREERCALSGAIIQPQASMLLGWTTSGKMIPLSVDSMSSSV